MQRHTGTPTPEDQRMGIVGETVIMYSAADFVEPIRYPPHTVHTAVLLSDVRLLVLFSTELILHHC